MSGYKYIELQVLPPEVVKKLEEEYLKKEEKERENYSVVIELDI